MRTYFFINGTAYPEDRILEFRQRESEDGTIAFLALIQGAVAGESPRLEKIGSITKEALTWESLTEAIDEIHKREF